MKFPLLRRAAPGNGYGPAPAPRHEMAGGQWHWLVTGDGDTMTGAPFPDRETAMLKFFRHVATFGDGTRARVVADREWRRIRSGPGYCPGINWAEVVRKDAETPPAPCGWAYPHRRHPLARQPQRTPVTTAQ